jgi:hypothetical protein
MKKYIIMALCIIHSLNAMNSSTDTSSIINDLHPMFLAYHHLLNNHSFKDLKVLSLNEDNHIEQCIAQSAKTVHLKNDQKMYDLVVVLDFPLQKKELRKNLYRMRHYTKPCGQLFGTIRTKTNSSHIEELIIEKLYPEIYTTMTPQQQQKCNKIFAKADIQKGTINFKKMMPTDDEVKQQIVDMGYEIISYIHHHYNITIKNQPSFESELISNFTALLQTLHNSTTNDEQMCQQFAKLVIAQLKKDNENNLIYPFTFTEMHLRKAKNEIFKFYNFDCSGKKIYEQGSYVQQSIH